MPTTLDQHPLPPPPVKFAVKDTLPGAKVQAAVGDGTHDFAPHHLRSAAGLRCRSAAGLRCRSAAGLRCRSAAGLRCPLQVRAGGPVLSSRTPPRKRSPGCWDGDSAGVLTGAVVQPAQRPASSLINTLAVMCIADTRISALFVVYHTRAPDGRGPAGDRPRPEQPQLNPTLAAEDESCCGSARRYCTGKASRQQGAMNRSS
jgi:hypothetical protein